MREGGGARSAADLAMDRYASGHDEAFGEVYDAVGPRLLAYLRHALHDRCRAEDIVQQTMLHIHRARGRFVTGAAVLPWAFAIARRLMIDCLRRERRRGAVPLEEHGDASTVRDGGAGADQMYEADEVSRRLALELGRLPASQRHAFTLLKQEGLSLQEAAEVLGVTVMAVKLRAHRAYEALRAVLGEETA